jgi:hypothetical protein
MYYKISEAIAYLKSNFLKIHRSFYSFGTTMIERLEINQESLREIGLKTIENLVYFTGSQED